LRICKQGVTVLFLSGAAISAALTTGGSTSAPEVLRLRKTADAMGTTYSVELYGVNRTEMEAAADAALDAAGDLDVLLSNYKPQSEWSEVNRRAASSPVKVSPELFDLLSRCLDYSRQSEGAFDITVGPLMKVWGFYKGTGRLPHNAEVAAAMTKVGYRHIRLDAANRTVAFDREGVELDPGGIGKGYAVDRMVEVLKSRGVASAFVSGSISSMYALGAPPDEPRGWHVAIRDPRRLNKSVTEFYLKDVSMSTSGSYEKFFVADGKTYAHIMDPRTGYPAQGSASVSVIAPRTLDSEAWCKPYFINGRQWAAKHKPNDVRVFFCEDRTDSPCAWLP
jgi:FAD:protein FMN transferase